MSGRRRAVRPARRRGPVIVGVFAFVAIVCAAAAALALGAGDGRPTASSSHSTGPANSPMSTQGTERDAVPDACEALSQGVARTLAPGADRTAMTKATDSDQHTECAWSRYSTALNRQLTVELRALSGQGANSATSVATTTFRTEWETDRTGRNLAELSEVRAARGVGGVGEQAYVVYTVQARDGVGEAVANVRLANVMVTVHYSGGDFKGDSARPLPEGTAMDGALSAARDVISKLESHQ